VFSEEVTPRKLLVPLRLLGEIEKEKRKIQKKLRAGERVDTRMIFLIDGAYHVLFALCQTCENANIKKDDEESAKGELARAIELVADLVQSEIASDETFTFNRFFKDAKTKVKIQAEAEKYGRPIRKKKLTARSRVSDSLSPSD
jgi:hypothetical protein